MSTVHVSTDHCYSLTLILSLSLTHTHTYTDSEEITQSWIDVLRETVKSFSPHHTS